MDQERRSTTDTVESAQKSGDPVKVGMRAMEVTNMKDLLLYIAKSMVDNPDEVSVTK